jgi:hypothetical protein
MLLVLFLVSAHSADGTKDWRFLGYGTYIVPEDFPDKFLEFPSLILAEDEIADGRAVLRLVVHKVSTALTVHTVCYLGDKTGLVVVVGTISVIEKDKMRRAICMYVDEQLLKTGKPSFILTKTDKKLDFEKFKRERELELGKVGI